MELFRTLFTPPRHWILVLMAVWIGLGLSEKRLKAPITAIAFSQMVSYGVFGYVVGGRLFYALEHWSQVLSAPLSLFSLNDMFSPFGAWLTLLMLSLIYLQRHQIPLWPMLDSLTPLLATLLLGLTLANLASGNGFGKETNLPWGWDLWGVRRHPSQLYEIFASFVTLVLILRLRLSAPGALFLRFLALTAGWMLFLQAFREDSYFLPGGFRLEQVLAWCALALALWLIDGREGRQASHES